MKNAIVAVLFVLVSVASAHAGDKWYPKTLTADSIYTSTYVTLNEKCRVMIPKEGDSIFVGAYEKLANGITNEQFAEVKGGWIVDSSTYRTYPQGSEFYKAFGLTEHVEDRFVFSRVCSSAAKNLPLEVRTRFNGAYGISE